MKKSILLSSLILLIFAFTSSCNFGNQNNNANQADTLSKVQVEETTNEKATQKKKSKVVPMSKAAIKRVKKNDEIIHQLEQLVYQSYDSTKYSIYFERKNAAKNKQVARLTNKISSMTEIVVFFDSAATKIINEIDLLQNNPYLKYVDKDTFVPITQQLIGYHKKVDNNGSLEGTIPTVFEKVLDQMAVSSVSVNISAKMSGDNHYIVSYTLSLLPHEEILQDVTVPTISTVDIYNMQGDFVDKMIDLPHGGSVDVSSEGKYALLIHQLPLNTENYKITPYQECVKIIDLTSKNECYNFCVTNNEIFGGISTTTNRLMFVYNLPRERDPKNSNFFCLFENENFLLKHNNVVDLNALSNDSIKLIFPDQRDEVIHRYKSQLIADLNCET